jgi:tetratricopeptide (TPR) repeat protein
LRKSLSIQKELGDNSGLAHTLWVLGGIALDREEYEEAKECLERSRQLYTELEDTDGLAGVFHYMGILAQDLGDYKEARALYLQSLDMAAAAANESGIAATLAQLGTLAEAQGRLEESVILWVYAAAKLEELGSPHVQIALDSLDEASEKLGEERCHEIFEDAGLS